MRSCFVIMPFSECFNATYEKAIKLAVTNSGLRCVRADEIEQPGEVMDHIRTAIRNATVCIADLTGLNSNVMYEVAVAHTEEKPVIQITRDSLGDLPFDVRGRRSHRYDSTDAGLSKLRSTLESTLKAVLESPESDVQLLREMLLPKSLSQGEERPFVIAASPLSWREVNRSNDGFKMLRHTCSDYVGIRGLIQAFGGVYALDRLPDLLDPTDYADNVVLDYPMHIYSIGSPKANPWTGLLLREFFRQWKPELMFRADPSSDDLLNVRILLYSGDDVFWPPQWAAEEKKTSSFELDFGLLIRGPHPVDPNCLFMVLAGRSSLGTEAACLAATNPQYIAEIRDDLRRDKVDLKDHRKAFYAIVEMKRDMTADGTYEALPSTYKLRGAHAFNTK